MSNSKKQLNYSENKFDCSLAALEATLTMLENTAVSGFNSSVQSVRQLFWIIFTIYMHIWVTFMNVHEKCTLEQKREEKKIRRRVYRNG